MIFQTYGGRDGVVSVAEFTMFLKDRKLLDGKSLTQRHLTKIFNNVQNDGDPADGDELTMDEAEMDYSEFCESIAAIGSFCSPDPYIDYAQRLEVFILSRVVNHITEKQVRKWLKK